MMVAVGSYIEQGRHKANEPSYVVLPTQLPIRLVQCITIFLEFLFTRSICQYAEVAGPYLLALP